MDSKKMLSIVLASLASLNSLASATPKVEDVKAPSNIKKGEQMPINSGFSKKAKKRSATKMNPGEIIPELKPANLVGNFKNVKGRPANANIVPAGGKGISNLAAYGFPVALGAGAGALAAGVAALRNKLRLGENSKKAKQSLESEEENSSVSTEASSENSESLLDFDVPMGQQEDNQIPTNENEVVPPEFMDVKDASDVQDDGKNNEVPGDLPDFSVPMGQKNCQAPQVKKENLPVFNEPIVEENVYPQVKEEEVTHVSEQPKVETKVETNDEASVVQKKLVGKEAEKEKTKVLKSIEDNVSLVFYEYKKNKAKWFPILEQKISKGKYSCGALVRLIKSNYNGKLEWEDLPVLFDVNAEEHGKINIYFQKIISSLRKNFKYDAVLFDDFKHPDFEKCETKLTSSSIGIFQDAVEYKLRKLFEEHGLEYDSSILQERLKIFGLGIAAKYTAQMWSWRDSRVPLFYNPSGYKK